MAWTGQWSIKSNGNELNSLTTGGPYSTVCPEVDWDHEQQIKFVPIDGDYPAYVGLQPMEGPYTLLVQMNDCDEATYQTQLAQLKSWIPEGQLVLTFQVRGMAAPKTVTVVRQSCITNFKARQVTFKTIARKPVLV